MLKWFYSNKQTQLCLSWVEDMTKICTYYLSNSDKEFQFYNKDLSNKELYKSINMFMITYDLLEVLNKNTDGVNNLDDNNNSEILESSTLNIMDFVNLTLPEFSATEDTMFSSESVTTNQDRDIDNMNYDSIELACQMTLQVDD
ncbi:16774_t:CDS:1 [Cetraspora pellucida]|uniref:16774_t:CDS:1 n=1 Tax=Cetraspora pellucida TaxID=1433469 RepID=A0A9N8YYX7_9GLOM|nr:16774_t:CDS:1 [Cetraspora pellucida]